MSEQKVKKEKKGAMSFLSKEYKYENLILAFIALFAIVLGVLIISGALVVDSGLFLIGSYPKVFAWILVGLGAISLLLVVYPFYKPSFDEAKHIKGLKRSEFLINIVRVLVFIVVLALFFFVCDLALDPLMQLFK
ncbi:MAG: preprotein translocase subunit SecE [Bacilli bacterium]|nr:preprotein translocase subunit SecE [Bacilli bacterium]